jgi:hypothetical protein
MAKVSEIPPEATVTLQYQYRKCGKPQCNTCKNGLGHGKYWYGYWRDPQTKKLHATYFGKNDPRGTVQETAAALAKGRQG